jgi:hypothetical protein
MEASLKVLFTAVHESLVGTFRTCRVASEESIKRSKADVKYSLEAAQRRRLGWWVIGAATNTGAVDWRQFLLPTE